MMENRIKEIVLSLGADLCGIASAELFTDCPDGFAPTDVFNGCKSVIAFGVALPKGLARSSARLVYSHFNSQVCAYADRIAFDSAKMLEREFSCTAVPIPCDTPYEYWDAQTLTGRGTISMKNAAVLAGIGSLGKSTLLLTKEYGNFLTVGAVLTDLALKSDEPCESVCIKDCTKCIDNCPVHAISADGHVDQSLCRPNSYGKTARGFDIVECSRCRTECPRIYGIKK